jgi:hypothetical protein
MRVSHYFFVVVTLLIPAICLAQNGANGGTAAAERMQLDFHVTGGVTTLYALDPLAHTLCFADGKDGSVFQENEVRNRCSDIDFNTYQQGAFSVGIEGGRTGTIVDLGNPAALSEQYGSEGSFGNYQWFASLRMQEGKLVIARTMRPQTTQEIKESTLLYKPSSGMASASVKVGNIYLIRLTDRYDKRFERLAKLIVIGYVPNESVTFRWHVL